MPETTIEIRSDPLPPKDHVGAPAQTWQGGRIHPVSEPLGMNETAKGDLGCRVSHPLPLETATDCFRGGDRRRIRGRKHGVLKVPREMADTFDVSVQDDARELELVELFELLVPSGRGRSDVDAVLEIDGQAIAFELKSSTNHSVSTSRDVGMAHIAKWRTRHWLFGFYDRSGTQLLRCFYGSPAAMKPWIDKLEAYIAPDFLLAEAAARDVDESDVVAVLGDKPIYTIADVKAIQKKQWTAEDYLANGDLPGGYSKARVAALLRDRCRYLMSRGATLNNPHIPGSHFVGCERITESHPTRLRALVRDYLAESALRMEQATA